MVMFCFIVMFPVYLTSTIYSKQMRRNYFECDVWRINTYFSVLFIFKHFDFFAFFFLNKQAMLSARESDQRG